jgi:ATP-binding cassette subfamily B protein
MALVALRDLRNVAARLFAPLGAPEAPPGDDATVLRGPDEAAAIELREVTVQAGGATILKDLSVSIPGGTHVGIVGASGAGKSSILSLLLGWLEASNGVVEIDGRPLTATRIARLREETAWVDPAVHLFKRTLFENITFSGGPDASLLERLPRAMADADLTDVLESLPDGMQADVGEAGVRLSGGQGQRVRLARALMREPCRLVLLDEPFRGLERERRRELLRRARDRWRKSTLVLVSHDVSDTLDLDRVLVIDGGRIVEDGSPRELMKSNSRYRRLAEADASLRTEAWAAGRFRSASMRGGTIASEVSRDSVG